MEEMRARYEYLAETDFRESMREYYNAYNRGFKTPEAVEWEKFIKPKIDMLRKDYNDLISEYDSLSQARTCEEQSKNDNKTQMEGLPDSRLLAMTNNDSIQKADRALQLLLVLLGILQATLFQFVMSAIKMEEQKGLFEAVAFLVSFTWPFLVATFCMLRVTLAKELTSPAIACRIVAWATSSGGFTFFYVLFIVFSILKPVTINPSLVAYLVLPALLALYFFIPTGKILQLYKEHSSNLGIWRRKYQGRVLWNCAEVGTVLVCLAILVYLR